MNEWEAMERIDELNQLRPARSKGSSLAGVFHVILVVCVYQRDQPGHATYLRCAVNVVAPDANSAAERAGRAIPDWLSARRPADALSHWRALSVRAICALHLP